jgi:hypothetical protein
MLSFMLLLNLVILFSQLDSDPDSKSHFHVRFSIQKQSGGISSSTQKWSHSCPIRRYVLIVNPDDNHGRDIFEELGPARRNRSN